MDAIGVTPTIHPYYAAAVLAGLAIMFAFPVTHSLSRVQKREYYRMQCITLIAAVVGAKFAVVLGDALWPLQPFDNWVALLYSGRSIVGALLFGFLVSEATKPLLNYSLPPNDRFAVVLPFSIGTGRLGCYFAGCCLGIPDDGMFSIAYADGIPRVPIALYELTFHFISGFALWNLYRRSFLTGRLFATYLTMYGLFRFVTEWFRVTEKAFGGLSAYQWLALVMVLAGIVTIMLRRGNGCVNTACLNREVAR